MPEIIKTKDKINKIKCSHTKWKEVLTFSLIAIKENKSKIIAIDQIIIKLTADFFDLNFNCCPLCFCPSSQKVGAFDK